MNQPPPSTELDELKERSELLGVYLYELTGFAVGDDLTVMCGGCGSQIAGDKSGVVCLLRTHRCETG